MHEKARIEEDKSRNWCICVCKKTICGFKKPL